MNIQLTTFPHQPASPLPAPQEHSRPVITHQSLHVGADAMRLLESGNFCAARARIKSLRFNHSTAPEGYLLFIMVTYAKEGSARLALRYARQVLTANPRCVIAMLTAAEMLARLGSLDESETLAREIIALYPNESGAWTTLAVAASRRGRREEAVTHVQQALRIQPHSQTAILMLSTLLFALDQHGEAIPWLQRRLKRVPADHEARFMLGTAQSAVHDYASAVRSFRRALASGSLDEESQISALSHIASAYLSLGNLNRYGEYVVQLASRYGYDPLVHQLIETLEEEAGEIRQAAADPEVRRLDAIYKVLMRSKPLADELHALNVEVEQTWEEVANITRKIHTRPMNKKVGAALAANEPTLRAANKLEQELTVMFEELNIIVDSASDCSSDFTPARFREHLTKLQQYLLRATRLAQTALAVANATFTLQTLQLGH